MLSVAWSRFVRKPLLVLMLFSTWSLMAGNWPSFRGIDASGVALDAKPPTTWNGATGANLRWKTRVPGLGHSSPVVWGKHVYLTSAVGEKDTPALKIGLYGESPEHPEDEVFAYKLLCYDRADGRLVWEQTAHQGKAQVKRHIKSSHANPTVATDGKVLLAFFGSEGLYCYSMEGKLLWKKNFGLLDSGYFDAHEVQWGFGSSPTLYKDRVVILCDANNQTFIAALDVKTGNELWRTKRDENPTWGTPTVVNHKGRDQILVNGYKHIGAYDLADGSEIWKLRGGGDIPIPTPVVSNGIVYITNAHGGSSPIYAVSLDATGDITPAEGETSNAHVLWSYTRFGAYMPTPLVYEGYVYSCNNSGILTCFDALKGTVVYRQRLAGRGGSFTASPVAADGKVFLTDEEGDIHVVKAGPKYELLATNTVDGLCLATPALVDDLLLVRTSTHLLGFGEGGHLAVTPKAATPKEAPVASAPKALAPLNPNDARSILTHVDAATFAVSRVRYTAAVKGEGALANEVSGEFTFIMEGRDNGLPSRFKGEGTVQMQGKPQKVTLGRHEGSFYAANPATQTLHSDLDIGVLGSLIAPLRQTMFGEFNHPQPFSDEINSPNPVLLPSETVEGVDCYVIKVTFPQVTDSVTTWYFAKSDLLPRARHDVFKLEGKDAGVFKRILKLEREPAVDATWSAPPQGLKPSIEAVP